MHRCDAAIRCDNNVLTNANGKCAKNSQTHAHTRDKLNLKMNEEEEENHEALANAVVEFRLFIQILCQPKKKKNSLSLSLVRSVIYC